MFVNVEVCIQLEYKHAISQYLKIRMKPTNAGAASTNHF